MPNWCSSAYVIEGDAKEIKSLYELMKKLEDMENLQWKTASGLHGWDALWMPWARIGTM